MSSELPCYTCGRYRTPWHDADAPGPTMRHPFLATPPGPPLGRTQPAIAQVLAKLEARITALAAERQESYMRGHDGYGDQAAGLRQARSLLWEVQTELGLETTFTPAPAEPVAQQQAEQILRDRDPDSGIVSQFYVQGEAASTQADPPVDLLGALHSSLQRRSGWVAQAGERP